MKKAEKSRVFPYTIHQLQAIILHPERYNIRDYSEIKKMDEKSWVEDYDYGFMVHYEIVVVDEQSIVLKNYQAADSTNYVKQMIFQFESLEDKKTKLTVSEKVQEGNIIRRITKFVDARNTHSTYYTDILDKIERFCKKTY